MWFTIEKTKCLKSHGFYDSSMLWMFMSMLRKLLRKILEICCEWVEFS
jgi:hypothetical protein